MKQAGLGKRCGVLVRVAGAFLVYRFPNGLGGREISCWHKNSGNSGIYIICLKPFS
jgi:hypothetical protein